MTAAARSLFEAFGEGDHAPTEARWQSLLGSDPGTPLIVTNLFRVREQADPRLTDGEVLSGFEAMLRYSAVSEVKVAALGGRFAVRALAQGTFIGDDSEWNLIVVADYPKRAQFIALLQDREYQAAFRYRTAAVEAQKVMLAAPI